MVPEEPEQAPPLDLEQAARQAIEALCHARDATHMGQLVAPDLTRHSNGSTLESPPTDADLARLYGAFADIQVTVQSIVVEADRVALQSTWSVRTDVAADPETFGVALTGRFEDGRLVETWETWDTAVVEAILASPADPKRWWQR
jgi:predicted ester cyclase